MIARDPSLDSLLDLHGQILVINEAGYWVKFIVHQVPTSTEKPHGLDYSITLHSPDGTRLVGYDNAHQVSSKPRAEQDHKHRLLTIKPYAYQSAGVLIEDFWKDVESILREKGV